MRTGESESKSTCLAPLYTSDGLPATLPRLHEGRRNFHGDTPGALYRAVQSHVGSTQRILRRTVAALWFDRSSMAEAASGDGLIRPEGACICWKSPEPFVSQWNQRGYLGTYLFQRGSNRCQAGTSDGGTCSEPPSSKASSRYGEKETYNLSVAPARLLLESHLKRSIATLSIWPDSSSVRYRRRPPPHSAWQRTLLESTDISITSVLFITVSPCMPVLDVVSRLRGARHRVQLSVGSRSRFSTTAYCVYAVAALSTASLPATPSLAQPVVSCTGRDMVATAGGQR